MKKSDEIQMNVSSYYYLLIDNHPCDGMKYSLTKMDEDPNGSRVIFQTNNRYELKIYLNLLNLKFQWFRTGYAKFGKGYAVSKIYFQ